MEAATACLGVGIVLGLGWVGWKGKTLSEEEADLLFCGIVMALLAPWGWPVSYYFYLCLSGRQAILLYNMAKCTLYFAKLGPKANSFLRMCFECDDREVIMIFWTVAVYLWIRITACQSWDFPIDPSDPAKTFLSAWNGWNCTMGEFWFINAMWTMILSLGCLAAQYLIIHDTSSNLLYKQYLLRYKLIPDFIILAIVTIYNLIAYRNAQRLFECGAYYQSGEWVRAVWFLGQPLTTLIFFYRRHGVFKVRSGVSSDADDGQEQGLEERLNHQEIDREYSTISHRKSQVTGKQG